MLSIATVPLSVGGGSSMFWELVDKVVICIDVDCLIAYSTVMLAVHFVVCCVLCMFVVCLFVCLFVCCLCVARSARQAPRWLREPKFEAPLRHISVSINTILLLIKKFKTYFKQE